ncbi:hypothetical protein [Streptomyces coffeae]|uniref:DNA-binding protein n=1 Tax=Streptomyces coffeae TaxID=621382 RepID=A0ABS1NJZ3_9ACTN|nr:hypothetical protein [Streptomyces coffeae]MBL1100091.1 hypothetical protein [Streptomyces coffeae]
MTGNEHGPPAVVALPPLHDDRLYSAEEVSQYTGAKPQWLKRALRSQMIPGGYLGRNPVWTAQHIRDLIAQTHEPQKRPSRGGGNGRQRRGRRLANT